MATDAELRLRERLTRLRNLSLLGGTRVSGELEKLQRQLARIQAAPTDEEIWRSVELARHQDRPYTLDYVNRLFDDWVELHGDRGRADDHALVIGLGRFEGRTVALVGNQKGRDIKERTERNFGMAYPEGYRKAMRLMELAELHRFPLLSLVDIPGAYPGVAAEQHGQGGMIARSQALMARLGVPIVTCVIGEGGSGGAIATALADRVLMQENAIYTVISPEGCAAILWRDAGEAKKAAAAFKPDAVHCLELGVIDGIVPEPEGGAHTAPDEAARLLGDELRGVLEELESVPPDELKRRRRAKVRSLGVFDWVSVRVRMFPATASKEVRFHFLHKKDLTPIAYEKVRRDDREPVDPDEIVRGFEIEKGRYVPLEDDDLDRLDVELTHSIDICDFVSLDEIDPVFFRKAYYLLPAEGAEKPYRLLVRALEETGKVGIAKVVIRNKQHLAALRPYEGLLLLETMYYEIGRAHV